MEDYCVELAAKLGSSFTQDPQICRSYNHDLGEMPAVLLGFSKERPVPSLCRGRRSRSATACLWPTSTGFLSLSAPRPLPATAEPCPPWAAFLSM